jgi:cytoskeletal protein CcmA (bactofilin family)
MTVNPGRTTSSCISKGTRISGKVEFREMARIEGEAEGEITGDNIEIAPSAVVTARKTANKLKVGGQVNGEIVARERIEVLRTARLRCTIITPTLVVTEGGSLRVQRMRRYVCRSLMATARCLVQQAIRHNRNPRRRWTPVNRKRRGCRS